MPRFVQSSLALWQLDGATLTEQQWQWFLNAEAVQRFSELPINSSGTLLEFYLRQQSFEPINWMLDKGLSLNKKSSFNRYPLAFAAMNCDYDVFKFLIDAGADVEVTLDGNPKGLMPLISVNPNLADQEKMFAYLELLGYPQRDHYDKLTAQLINLNDTTDVGKLLENADLAQLERSSQSILGQMIKGGLTLAQFEQIPEDQLSTLVQNPNLLFDLARAFRSDYRIVEQVIEAGANVNQTRDSGFTPLIFAAQGGNAELVEVLLRYGADPSVETDTGVTVQNGMSEAFIGVIKYNEINYLIEKYSY